MMDPYVTALIIIAVLTYTIIMSLYMIEKTMRIENLDFTTDESHGEELQAEVPEALEAEVPEAEVAEAEEAEALEAEVPEAKTPEVELSDSEVDNTEASNTTEENIVILTPNEKLIVNKLFSHTIGQLLKIRLENERRRKLE